MINAVAHASTIGALDQTDGYVSVMSQSMRDMTQIMMTHVRIGRIGMETITDKITEARYKELEAMTYEEQHASLFPNGVPDAWSKGYGYYGHALISKGRMYFVQYKIGSSCD